MNLFAARPRLLYEWKIRKKGARYFFHFDKMGGLTERLKIVKKVSTTTSTMD